VILSRCPSCDTVFRVTEEQVAARRGMVRCGRCGTAFNALGRLVTPPPAPIVAPDEVRDDKASSADGGERVAAISTTPPRPEHGDGAAPPKPLAMYLQPHEASADAVLPRATARETKSGHAVVAPALTRAFNSAAAFLRNGGSGKERSAHVWVDALSAWLRRHHPMPAWAVAAVALACLAIAQFTYVFRGDIARAWPGTRPMLEAFCAPFGCRVELPRQADLIGIEVSDLQPDRGHADRLILAATLRNRAPFAQSHPYLELTLTDARDRALARRVIAPEEYLGPGAAASAGIPANAEQVVQLVLGTNGVAASGYRLYVFYP